MTGTTSPQYSSVWRVTLPLMVAEIVATLELTMIYAAMRSLVEDLGSAAAAGWLVTAFMLSSAAGAALFGRLGDLLGRRRILLWVLAISTFGSVISSITMDLGWLIAGRAMQGAAGAIVPLCLGIVRARVTPAQVPFSISILLGAITIAAGSGLVLGGLVVDFAGWPTIFKFTAVMGTIAFLGVMFFIPRDTEWNPGPVKEDLLGGMLFVPAAIFLLLAIDRIGQHGFGDRSALVFGVLAVISLVAWIWRELSVPNPLIQVRLLMTRDIGWANLLYVPLALGVFQGGYIMALFGQQSPATGVGLGLSATAAGFLLLPANIITALCYPLISKSNVRFGPRNVASCGYLMIIAGFGGLIIQHHAVTPVLLLLVIQGIGLGMVYVTIPLVIVAASPPDRVSEATGMMTVIRATTMAIGAQTIATMLSRPGSHGTGAQASFPSESDYTTVFLFVCITALAGVFLARLLPAKLAGTEHQDIRIKDN